MPGKIKNLNKIIKDKYLRLKTNIERIYKLLESFHNTIYNKPLTGDYNKDNEESRSKRIYYDKNVANNTISTRSKQFFNSTRQSPKTLTERSIDKIKDKKDRYAAHAFGNNKLESIERNLSKTFLLRKEGSVQRLEFN